MCFAAKTNTAAPPLRLVLVDEILCMSGLLERPMHQRKGRPRSPWYTVG